MITKPMEGLKNNLNKFDDLPNSKRERPIKKFQQRYNDRLSD